MREQNENFNKELENIKKYSTEIIEMKNNNNKTEKFNRGIQHQTKYSRRNDQQIQRQWISSNHSSKKKRE